MTVNISSINSNSTSLDQDVFTPTDDVEISVIAPNGVASYPRGFICNADGDLAILNMQGDIRVIPVLRGIPYSIACKEFRATGTVNVTSVVALG